MKLNENTWHYKMVRTVDGWPRDNLCPYVRQVIGAILLYFLMGALIGFLASVVVGGIFQWVMFFATGFWTPYGVIGVLFIMFNVLSAIIMVGGCGKAADRGWEKLKNARGNEIKEPSIFWEWCKAKHRKICPKIAWSSEGV